MQQTAEIISIDSGVLECRVLCGDACQGCAARRVCGTEDTSKTITLFSDNSNHKVGDSITIELTPTMGLKAVFLAYLLPVLIIVALLLILNEVGYSELYSGLIALGTLALYFICVKIFKVGRSISITIVGDNKTI